MKEIRQHPAVVSPRPALASAADRHAIQAPPRTADPLASLGTRPGFDRQPRDGPYENTVTGLLNPTGWF